MGQVNVNPSGSGDGGASAAAGMGMGMMLVILLVIIAVLALGYFVVYPMFSGPANVNVNVRSSDVLDAIARLT